MINRYRRFFLIFFYMARFVQASEPQAIEEIMNLQTSEFVSLPIELIESTLEFCSVQSLVNLYRTCALFKDIIDKRIAKDRVAFIDSCNNGDKLSQSIFFDFYVAQLSPENIKNFAHEAQNPSKISFFYNIMATKLEQERSKVKPLDMANVNVPVKMIPAGYLKRIFDRFTQKFVKSNGVVSRLDVLESFITSHFIEYLNTYANDPKINYQSILHLIDPPHAVLEVIHRHLKAFVETPDKESLNTITREVWRAFLQLLDSPDILATTLLDSTIEKSEEDLKMGPLIIIPFLKNYGEFLETEPGTYNIRTSMQTLRNLMNAKKVCNSNNRQEQYCNNSSPCHFHSQAWRR